MATVTKGRNNSIDIFRYICAIMVVIIHTHPFSAVNANADYITSQIMTRIGVPFFFSVAGYFYTQKLEKEPDNFLPYVKKLFLTYSIWSCAYLLTEFISWGHGDLKGFLVSSAIKFFIKGSYYHFWFFPALIISVCLTTLLYKKCKKLLIPLSLVFYAIGCLGGAYFNLGVKLPVLGTLYTLSEFITLRRIFMMGFPFFICGYFVNKIKDKVLPVFSNKKILLILPIAVVLWLAEIFTVVKLGIQREIVITFALYPLLMIVMLILLKYPLPQFNKLSQTSRVVANFTYYTHPLFMLLIKSIYSDISKFAMFLLVLFLTLICGLILSKFNNKFIKMII